MKRYIVSDCLYDDPKYVAKLMYSCCKYFLDNGSTDCEFHKALYSVRKELVKRYPCSNYDGWEPVPTQAPSLPEVED